MKVIAVFDVGKTNKKLFLFDEQYRIVDEQSVNLTSGVDEDGDACEDLTALTEWMQPSLQRLMEERLDLRLEAVNFAAYGASFVHVGSDGRPVAPLYNYLKPYPEALRHSFYAGFGGETEFSMVTASPVLGSLNSGMQLYRLKHERPQLFDRIRYSIHLPQYLSFLYTRRAVSDITSIGCHTNLWDFRLNRYHEWVYREAVIDKLAPIVPSDSIIASGASGLAVGVGLHDSSAAIIPYLRTFREPFVLVSTGTWCISLNPFNPAPLTAAELQQDCLSYMSYEGRPVKASRLFAGYEHEQQVKRIADHFQRAAAAAAGVRFDPGCVRRLLSRQDDPSLEWQDDAAFKRPTSFERQDDAAFERRELSAFNDFEEAYHCLMTDIIRQQVRSTRLVMDAGTPSKIFVDGGFGKNDVYMHLLAAAMPGHGVYAASMSQATAMGAALAIHHHWNHQPTPEKMVELKKYPNLPDT